MDYNPSGSSAHGILQARILGEPKYFPNPGIELVSLMIPAVAVGFFTTKHHLGFPGGSDGKESACNAGDQGSTPGLRRSPEEGNTVVFLSGELYGQRSLVGYSSWRYKE